MADTDQLLKYQGYAFWCFVFSIVLLPIGLGGDRPLPFGLMQCGLAISCVFLALSPDLLVRLHFSRRLRLALVFLAVALIWAVLQMLPIMPQSWMHPLWKETAHALNTTLLGSISIVPEDSLKGLMRLLTTIAAGILGFIFASDRGRARQIVQTFWITGTVICCYGLLIQITGLHQILWFDKWAYIDDATATFVNRNHFAIYAGLVLTAGMALMLQSWRDALKNCKPHKRIAQIREWLLHEGMPRTVALAFVLFSIALSHSRAGLVWALLGLGSYVFFYQIYLRSWRRAFLVGFLVIAVLAFALGVALQVSDRFQVLFDDYSSEVRGQVYGLTLRAIQDNPLLGYGLNGFEPEFRLYQHNMFEEFNHAHSDVLESLLDLGLVAGGFLWAALALFLSGLWRGILHRRQAGMFPTLALAASLMVFGHAMVDFDLQIPGVAVTWAVLLGTGLAQSWGQSDRQRRLRG